MAFTMKTGMVRRMALSAAVAAAIAGVTRVGGAPETPQSSTLSQRGGVTRPSDERYLAFPGPGVIKEVLVKAGDTVKAGQLLASQDDSVELAKLASIEVEAKSDLQVKAADADLAQKKVALGRQEKLYAEVLARGETNSDLDDARVAVTIGQIAVEYRKQEKHQKELDAFAQQEAIRQKKMVCPFDGVVAKVDIHPGEGTMGPERPCLQVVQNEPLWVEVEIASARAKAFRLTQELDVRYTDEQNWMPAKIIFITPFASAGSNTTRVRLQMMNTANRPAGLQVMVKLPDDVATAQPVQ